MIETMMQLIPITLVGLVYAAIVFVVARKRRINPWGWTIGSLVPGIGLIVAGIFWILTLLSVLDRLDKLETSGQF